MQIRHATNGDWAVVRELMQQQNRFHVDLVPHIIKPVEGPNAEAWVRNQLADENVTIFLAEDEKDAAVGLINLVVKKYGETSWSHAVALAYVDELFVVPAARRQGIARRLVDRARDFAKEKSLSAVSLNVWGANKNAIEAYDALGFQTVTQRMTLLVD